MGKFPKWADQKLSKKLPALREQGEGQTLEYKQAIPDNKWNLAKEIAAFATSNDGMILIGVADNGELVGLEDADTSEKRDELCRRVEALCTAVVAPSLTPSISFLQENGKTVMAISVARGPEPVYYCDGRPCIRHLSESRAARPHEVVGKIRESLGLPAEEPDDDHGAQLAGRATDSIFRMIEAGASLEDGKAPQNLAETLSEFDDAADSLRMLAASDESYGAGWSDELMTLSDWADDVANLPQFIDPDSIAESKAKVSEIVSQATEFYERRIATIPVSNALAQRAFGDVRRYARELSAMAQKIEQEGVPRKLADVQLKVGLLGFYIQARAWWGLHQHPKGSLTELRALARRLRAMPSMPVFMDEGASTEAIAQEIVDCDKELGSLLARIEADSRKNIDAD